ncbi:glycerophosphoryl diester phosphodiesterase [Natrinema hispanicum]|uniref:Glycerophosphoryl diester phosphodiesterase n=2 Tax=Natrinema hispanicum TaxID=392421 RepID=A0A1I0IN70_9EURY|nr:glycerophosphoryl diester phosphodiesterase [Natrinema hispanicum]SET98486.1 glycerophosphoryl diester phosphodiesterase [Natrinema hispanicum]
MSRDNTRIMDRVSRRNVVKATGAALGVSMVSSTGTAHGSPSQGSQEKPHITAHRGFRDVFPQNTIAAMEGSSRLGADRIEIDVEATSDGKIVVFHDAALDDLTDKDGLVSETPSETVLKAEVLESGETIPTLAETLDAVKPSVTMNIEFKDSGPLSWDEFAERALGIASQYPGEYYVSSFDPDALRAVRDVDPRVDVAPIFGANKAENVDIARELDAVAVNPSTGILDRDLVETAHSENRDVNVWTIDSWREARAPLELNVDGLIADFPHMAAFATSETRRDRESGETTIL